MMNSQRDVCLTKAFKPQLQIYKPSKGRNISFVSMLARLLSVKTNYSRVESKKITKTPTNWRVEKKKGTPSQEFVISLSR